MIRVILNGAGGRMGREIEEILLSGDGDAILAAAVDKNADNVPFKKLVQVTCEADVIVDFSHHSATNELTLSQKDCPLLSQQQATQTRKRLLSTKLQKAFPFSLLQTSLSASQFSLSWRKKLL